MSCGIYKITNLINGHSYIGQSCNIEKRWERHRYYTSSSDKNKILYKAFQKYGIENFSFEIIEECLVTELNEREIYWIKYYDTYYNGYNATLGGGGMLQANSQLILKLWNENFSLHQISKITGHDRQVIKTHLRVNGITDEQISERGREQKEKSFIDRRKKVAQVDKDTGEILRIFPSAKEAAEYIGSIPDSVKRVCRGAQQTLYGYKWIYIE